MPLDGCFEFKDKNSNHLFEFNSKVVFEISIVDKDILLVRFEDEYLLFSEEIELDFEFNLDVVDKNLVLEVKLDSPVFNINNPHLFFVVHQQLVLKLE